ncbi:MAG: Mrp/NBP35 family ATP-binding protein [Clostridia bacterium]|nr:Mrp/NBP35 family ATP-binding protein [Clostridia bacterium]
MSECTHDCSTCTADCSSRTAESQHAKLNELSKVGKVIAVVSGKGGVGKSLVTSLLATLTQRKDKSTAILDADITGPSIPQAFGLHCNAMADDKGIYPVTSANGTQIMSINLLLENEADPVVWRGPVIAGAVTQFWTDVVWDDVDFMFVDMPPGTGDVPLTVFQSLPVDGIVVVTSPQELVGMIVSKAVKMAEMLNVPIIGLVENMSYFNCPDCGKQHKIYGESNVDKLAEQYGIDTVCKLPIDPKFATLCDKGAIEAVSGTWLDALVDKIIK